VFYRIFLVITLIFFSGLLDARVAWLDQFAVDLRIDAANKGIPGFIIVVVEEGKPNRYYTFGYTRKGGTRIGKDTMFRLASVSKTFTGTLLAMQQDNPDLKWNKPLNDLTPQYDFSESKNNPIRLQHVIGQSTGFTPNAYDNVIEAGYERTRVMSMLADLEPLCEPGRCYTYQNVFFGLLEEYYLSNQTSFEKEIQKAIFDPLDMEATIGRKKLVESTNWARPHAAVARNRWREVSVKDTYYKYAGAAGINASAADMAKWLRAMLLEKPSVIDSAIVNEVTAPLIETKRELRRRGWRGKLDSAHYGLGWRVYDYQGVKINHHSGWVQGYRADVSFSPDLKTGIAFLMNAESNIINIATPRFWQLKYEQTKAK